MPYFYFKEIWTPLKLIGIKFYRDESEHLWVKFWNRDRRKVFK